MTTPNAQRAKPVYQERAPNVLCYGEPIPMAMYNEKLGDILSRKAAHKHSERLTSEEIKNIFAIVCADDDFRNADMKTRVYETFLRAAHLAEQRGIADPNNVVVDSLGQWVTLKLHGQVAHVWRNRHVKEIVDRAANKMRKNCVANYTQRVSKKDVLTLYEHCSSIEEDMMECIVSTIRRCLAKVS